MADQRGKFIVIEGIDGAGKSSQIDLLAARIKERGEACYLTCEPSGRPIGKLIRDVLTKKLTVTQETLAAMFLADRLDHIQNSENGILKHLEEGTHVISDRYYWSSYAYHSLAVDMDWVIDLNRAAAKLLRPDITIFLDLTAEKSFDRITKNRAQQDLFEKKELLEKVRSNYYKAFEKIGNEEKLEVIDADRTIEDLSDDIWGAVQKIF